MSGLSGLVFLLGGTLLCLCGVLEGWGGVVVGGGKRESRVIKEGGAKGRLILLFVCVRAVLPSGTP